MQSEVTKIALSERYIGLKEARIKGRLNNDAKICTFRGAHKQANREQMTLSKSDAALMVGTQVSSIFLAARHVDPSRNKIASKHLLVHL